MATDNTTDTLRELVQRLGDRARLPANVEQDLAVKGWTLPSWARHLPRGGKLSVLVCVPLDEDGLSYPDNRKTRCKECKRAIQYSSTAPKRVTKLCIDCALRQVRGDA